MPTIEQQKKRLIEKLKELFQLDQPELDFGFYKIMHAKSKQVAEFIENDLLNIITGSFKAVDESKRLKLEQDYEAALEQAKGLGAPDPENAPLVKKAKSMLGAAMLSGNIEAEIYDHLYRFFERYYESGDFTSRRYFARETSDKAAPFAVPYNGEEVKLIWANYDQYYIKTSEYFTNYSFDLNKIDEVIAKKGEDELFASAHDNKPLRVHFRVISATEGEHGNIKTADDSKRFFILNKEKPAEIDESNELNIYFEYRPDPEKSGQEGIWQKKLNEDAVKKIIESLDKNYKNNEFSGYFKIPAPTETQKNRILLEKYIGKYTARNTSDYFIHKDLKEFLNRELDFYIKNEVMWLDDIENSDVPQVESYLAKIKVIRNIAHKIIEFLSQLEEFQKKLWLKKKFVVETNYCITLDRVPEELYKEIAANDEQREEWIKLFAIDKIKPGEGDMHEKGAPGYSKPLKVEFIKANKNLVLDTKFFDEKFKSKLLSSIDNFDEQCNGLLVHSENFQALNLLQERYREQVKCVYIDPPYNTGNDENFTYKDNYQHSSWITLMNHRLMLSRNIIHNNSLFFASVDDIELCDFKILFNQTFGNENYVETICLKNKAGAGAKPKGFITVHEYILSYSKNLYSISSISLLPEDISLYNKKDEKFDIRGPYGTWALSTTSMDDRPNLRFPIIHNGEEIWPEKQWLWSKERVEIAQKNNELVFNKKKDGGWSVRFKRYLQNENGIINPATPTSFFEGPYTHEGTKEIKELFGISIFNFPKPSALIKKLISLRINNNEEKKSIILDYFAGSGTTGHAVINLNREDGGSRKYILVEMGDHFNTVLKPRIQKVVYSFDWKDGKPESRNTGISHCFKYLRLESYEDTLNNLEFHENSKRGAVISKNSELREEFMLKYMLDVETKGSSSLLNIDAFSNPMAYKLKVKKAGSDEHEVINIDLIETFNYLIGLRITQIALPETLFAKFKRERDPELPDDQHTKLIIDGKLENRENGSWQIRSIEGWTPADRANPDNSMKEKVLVIWRNLTSDIEKDNAILDAWFNKKRINPLDFEFNVIYVNGTNNLPNLKLDNENWKVRLIEKEFMKHMWEVE